MRTRTSLLCSSADYAKSKPALSYVNVSKSDMAKDKLNRMFNLNQMK